MNILLTLSRWIQTFFDFNIMPGMWEGQYHLELGRDPCERGTCGD